MSVPERDPLAWLSRPIAGRTLPARAIELLRGCLDRLVRMQFVDRAVALGSLAFTAMVPLMVIAGSFVPGGEDLSDELIDRFRLDGSTADLVRETFQPSDATRSTLSALGIVLLVGSALSFTRALQRTYEHAWLLDARGWAGTKAGLKWIVAVVLWATAFAALREWIVDQTGPVVALVVALAGGAALWLFTPWVLLAGRVTWRRLLPTALLSSIGMTALSVASVVYMPDSIADSADRYGSIGIAISLVSWLVGIGFVLVVCAGVGAVLGGETGRPPADAPVPE